MKKTLMMFNEIKIIAIVNYKLYCLFLMGLFFSCEREIYSEKAYCIENVNVVDPLEGLTKKVNVVIEGNKIKWIGNSDELGLSQINKIRIPERKKNYKEI